MSIFTKEEQEKYRKHFVEEARQKAWGCMCHADWALAKLDKVVASITKLEAEEKRVSEDLKALTDSPEYHTVENRGKIKALRDYLGTVKQQITVAQKRFKEGQDGVNGLYQNAESNLELEQHALTYLVKEVDTAAAEESKVEEAKPTEEIK